MNNLLNFKEECAKKKLHIRNSGIDEYLEGYKEALKNIRNEEHVQRVLRRFNMEYYGVIPPKS